MGQRKEPGMDFDLNVFEDTKSATGDGINSANKLPKTANGEVFGEVFDDKPENPVNAPTEASRRGAMPVRLVWGMTLVVLVSLLSLLLWVSSVAQSQQSIRRELDLATENIDAIGGALNSQGETILSKGGQTQEKIKFLDSEIRKLWHISNERNKQWITELQDKVSKLETTNAKLVQDVALSAQRMNADLGRVEEFAVSQRQAQVAIAALEESMIDLRALLQTNAETMAQLDEMVKSFAGQDLGGNIGQMSVQLDDLLKRMLAVDAHRRQVNRLLEQLDTEIRTLKAQP